MEQLSTAGILFYWRKHCQRRNSLLGCEPCLKRRDDNDIADEDGGGAGEGDNDVACACACDGGGGDLGKAKEVHP